MSSSLSKREVNRQRWSERIQHWKRVSVWRNTSTLALLESS